MGKHCVFRKNMCVFLSQIDTWRKFLGRACAVARLAMRQLVGG